ncbi:type II toxin-antitoxin system RelE/ParE family toxin [Catalinimonas alkaloidigena]|uniref:type II toxin-antitoxin system RelE/ParE family toxin n=1 Tax=Catalinimonas alkaloidigena TaxID=1075417 RepID=UPI000B7F4103|nr:type II toxin-antitoxin system RelE/ParE family toxin [Catalinimonas alkaloidigena]
MIHSFKSKPLRKLFEKGDASGLPPEQVQKIRRILFRLNTAKSLKDLNAPGLGLHKLTGNLEGFHAVKVTGNWRIIFRFEEETTYDVNYIDYH